MVFNFSGLLQGFSNNISKRDLLVNIVDLEEFAVL